MCTVVNKYKDEYDVYIGRGSPLGNLMPINEATGHTRDFVIEWYRQWLWEQIKTEKISKEYLLSLDGKRLGCFCAPKRCHGDIIKAAVEWLKKGNIC